MANRYFFDLPVYRIDRETYYRQRERHIDAILFPPDSDYSEELRKREKEDPSINVGIRDHLQRSYGGCWEFNEIVGYIRLHFLGSQVRGEYFAVRKKRIVRTRNKVLEYLTWKLAPEVDVGYPFTSATVLAAIRRYIEDCKKEVPGRFIDTKRFDAIADFVDWAALYRVE
jgi:hypothetical protein